MDRFYCYLAGFAIALALVAGFCIVKSVVEEWQEKQRDRMKWIAQDVCNKRFKDVAQYTRDLTVEIIDRRLADLAEKEGEHESD